MTITARYPGTCATCGRPFAANTVIQWERRTARHLECKAIDLSPIAAFLQDARDRGLAYPVLRVLAPDGVSELRLSLTVAGTAPGSIVVKLGRVYLGCIRPDGSATSGVHAALAAHLLGVAANPAQAAQLYAALTCRCSFCGLLLTDQGSVEAGYGPVCAAHWGLPHRALGTAPAARSV
jgi:hypothetical protein